MSARRKRAGKGGSAPLKQTTTTSESPGTSEQQKSSTFVSAESVLDECVGAICLVEVTLHSLASQEIASPEQEVLKRALTAIWSVHDWIYELTPDDVDGESDAREDEP